MPDDERGVSRRGFLAAAGLLAGGLLGRRAAAGDDVLPRRELGRTGAEVTVLGLGTACAGQSSQVSLRDAEAVYREAIEQGIGLLDSARGYEKAEQALGQAIRGRRDSVLITTKVRAESHDEARQSFEESLRRLQTDHIDIVYLHDLGSMNYDRAMGPGGSMEYLESMKLLGRIRFVGATSHCGPSQLRRAVESGRLDVVMMVMNFVDRHTYRFEEKVLPACREHGVAAIAMKVLGGELGSDFSRYYGPNPGPQCGDERVTAALRYALSLPGLASAVVGMHTVEQVRRNVALIRELEPYSAVEMAALEEQGKALADGWGLRFGSTA
ncbi:MAG: aldo/keto reductase [Armatimonadetes bacterium]|nr:aldo/keto reductase [Armatimonadota bacterium]